MNNNDNEKTIKGAIFVEKPDGRVPYILVLKKIKNNEINPNEFIFLDDEGISWVWSSDCEALESLEKDYYFSDVKSSKFLTDEYGDLDLVDLSLLLIPKTNSESTPKITAKNKIIDELEQNYIELSMEIDNCQGSMSNLDEAFEMLNIYKELVKYLGGNVDEHLQELTDNWFKKTRLENENKAIEQKRKDEVIKKLPLDIVNLITVDKNIMTTFIKQNDKINEICEILIENFKEK